MSDHDTVEHAGVELIRLLVPLVDGEPKYRHRLDVLSVNETYGEDCCLVEVPADDSNVEWALQDPGVVRYDYEGHIVEPGRNGPPQDPGERVSYSPSAEDRQPHRRPLGFTVFDPDEVDDEEVVLAVLDEREVPVSELPEYIRRDLGESYDLSGAIYKLTEGYIEGDGAPLRRIGYFVFPEAAIAVTHLTQFAEAYSGTRLRIAFNYPMIEDLRDHGVETSMFWAQPWMVEKALGMAPDGVDYVVDESLPVDEENDRYWYVREPPLSVDVRTRGADGR